MNFIPERVKISFERGGVASVSLENPYDIGLLDEIEPLARLGFLPETRQLPRTTHARRSHQSQMMKADSP